MRVTTGIAALAAVLLLLAACSATPSTPPTTGTTSATPEGPQTIIPLGCEQLLPTSTAQAAISTRVALQADETITPSSLLQAAYRQAGALDCEWTAAGAEQGTRADGVYLVVVPDALDALHQFQQFSGVDGSPQCPGPATGITGCYADFAVGTSWVSLSTADGTDPVSSSAFSPLLTSVTSALETAGPERTAWVAPAGSFSGTYFCDRTATVASHLQSAVGAAPDLSAGGVGGEPGTDATTFQKTGAAFCPWLFSKAATDDVELDITTLPGGAWAIGGLDAWLVRPGGAMSIASIAVPGVEAARAGCGTSGCSGYLSYRHSLISVGIDSPMNVTDFATLLGKLVDGVS